MWKEIRSSNINQYWQQDFGDVDEINHHFVNIIPNVTGSKEEIIKFYSEIKFYDNIFGFKLVTIDDVERVQKFNEHFRQIDEISKAHSLKLTPSRSRLISFGQNAYRNVLSLNNININSNKVDVCGLFI